MEINFKASEVLTDCRVACRELEDAEANQNERLIRIRWFTCLVLLRSVGHIIDKVDKKNYIKYKSEFDSFYKRKKQEIIFKDFIDKERNMILKEYKDYIINEESEKVESFHVIINDDGDRLDIGGGNTLIYKDDDLVTRYFKKGGGFDEYNLLHEIVSDAIKWWENYINELKIKINN